MLRFLLLTTLLLTACNTDDLWQQKIEDKQIIGVANEKQSSQEIGGRGEEVPADDKATQQSNRNQALGDWLLNCAPGDDPGKAKERCSLQQQLVTQKGERIVFVKIVKTDDEEKKTAVFVLPLGFYIPDGVEIAIDGRRSRRLLVTLCDQGGCVARIPLDDNLAYEMSAGDKMIISLVLGDRSRKMDFPISMKGFADGIDAVR